MGVFAFPPSPLVREIDFKQEKVKKPCKRELWLTWKEKERAELVT